MNTRDNDLCAKILKYCDEIEATHVFFHHDKALFCNKAEGFIYRYAVTMALLQIGELAKKLSDECRHFYSEIPWRLIVRTRDVYAHHYGDVEYEVVWETSRDSVSKLQQVLRAGNSENFSR